MNKKRQKKTRKGFTLVEMLLTVAIIGILSAVVLVNLRGGRDQKDVELAAREIAAGIKEAQNNALAGRRSKNEHLPCYYQIEPTSSLDGYVMRYIYRVETGNCNDSSNNAVYYSHVFGNNVKVSDFNPFGFNVPHGGTRGILSSEPRKIIIYKGSHSYTVSYTVCVYESGLVLEEAGNVDC